MESVLLNSSDFLVEVSETSVTLVVEPAERSYQFGRVTGPDDFARYGSLLMPHINSTDDCDGAVSNDVIENVLSALALRALFQ
jgi:hypothetical protein